MEANINLGRIWGIPIGLNNSWFLIFGLVTWSLAAGYFPAEYPTLDQGSLWVLGVVTSLLFAGSVLFHELGHTYLALRNNIPVKSISLFLFGGVAQISREPSTAGAELRIAIAGPIASFILAGLFWALHQLDTTLPYLAAPSLWLARINLSLALFNMIPGFPLDGGRVLRALVWKLTGSFHRATQVAAYSGQLVAFGFMGVGIFSVLNGSLFNGLWLAFIGWFLQNAASATQAQSNLQQSLRGVKVGQVMARDCSAVPSYMPLQQLVDDEVLGAGRRCFFVTDGGKLRGVLTLADITNMARTSWQDVTVGKAMVPWERLVKVGPDTDLLEALRKMDEGDVAQMPVVQDDSFIGMLTREQILRYLRLRAELRV